MLPVEEPDTALSTVSEHTSEEWSDMEDLGSRRDSVPEPGDIEDAIEKGDWAAVGATAAILASDSEASRSSSRASSRGSSRGSSEERYAEGDSVMKDSTSTPSGAFSGMSVDSATVDEDDARAAEIDQLVENGNWDGVVAVAARYAEEADEGSMHSKNNTPPRSREGSANGSANGSPESRHSSAGSVSVETADASSIYSNTTRDSASRTTYSGYTSVDNTTETGDGASTMDGTETSPPDTYSRSGTNRSGITPPDTYSSSITSSFVSGAVTESMVSAASTVDPQEKRQMNAYRAEVEALVRRVVPDEIDNVDDIMVQFSGREEELIETLRAMQEKSIAQRARAAVQKSAKKEAGKMGRGGDNFDESSQGSVSLTTDGGGTTISGTVSRATSRGESTRDGSITEQFTEGEEDSYSDSSSSAGSSRSDSVSSYTSGSTGTGSRMSRSEFSGSELGTISVGKSQTGDDIVRTSPGLGAAIDASDWRAVGEMAENLRDGQSSRAQSNTTGMTTLSKESRDEFDNMIDNGNWSGIIDTARNMSAGGPQGHADDLD
jgi:hypothetical protein